MTDVRCPNCNSYDAQEIDHPGGRWMCDSCGQLFDGGELEYLRMTSRRDAYLARLANAKPEKPETVEGFSTTRRSG